MPRPEAPHSSRYAPWLYLILGLFVLRVIAQPLALVLPAGAVPAFESWHSGALPYGWLLASQLLIIVALARAAMLFATGRARPRRRLGHVLVAFGGLYFASMLVRLVLGATWLSGDRWFASPIPTVFHLVLASALLCCGHFHVTQAPERSAEITR
jgi:hypothetical protein